MRLSFADVFNIKRVDRLVAMSVLGSLLMVWLVLTGFDAVTQFLRQLGSVGKHGYTLSNAVVYVLVTFPRRAYEMFGNAALIGGLLEHVVDLLQFCDLAAGHFPMIYRDLLLTGAILHDIGKIYELSWERGFEYTLEGQLIGHISIATRLLDEKVKALPGFPKHIQTLGEHRILSHHG